MPVFLVRRVEMLCSPARYGMVQCGAVWYNVVRCCALLHSTHHFLEPCSTARCEVRSELKCDVSLGGGEDSTLESTRRRRPTYAMLG